MSKNKSKKNGKSRAQNAPATDISRIDALIAEAQASKQKRVKGEKPPKKTDPERAAVREAKLLERQEKRAVRDQLRQAKRDERTAVVEQKRADRLAARALRNANKRPAHLAKLDRAMAKLPSTDDRIDAVLDTVAGYGFSAGDMQVLAEHVNFMARRSTVESALTAPRLNAGDTVTINAGRHAGRLGTVTRAQRIRCYVNVSGVAKDVYLFVSDVARLDASTTDVIDDSTMGEVNAI